MKQKKCINCAWLGVCKDEVKHRSFYICGYQLLGVPQKYLTRFNDCEVFREKK